MKNKDYEIIVNGYNNQLLRLDARKRVIDEMIKDLGTQYTKISDEWNGVWRERQQYINEHEEKEACAS
jgi:hypothetical protein